MITISHTQTSMFTGCPKLWGYRYLDKIKLADLPIFEFGRVVHNALEFVWEGEERLKQYIEGYQWVLSGNPGKDRAIATNLVEGAARLLKKEGIVRHPSLKPEKRMKVTVIPGKLAFQGVVDLVALKGDKLYVIDYKTTAMRFKDHDIITSYQLTGYCYIVWKKWGVIPDKIGYLTMNKNSGEVKLLEAERSEEALDLFEAALIDWGRSMHMKVTYRNPENCFAYNRTCDFYRQCWGE